MHVAYLANRMSAVDKALIVDDDEDLRDAVSDLLLVAGVRDCLAVASLDELADRVAEALACRLALIDINLGVGQPNGVDAFRWLRDRGYNGSVIFMTGHAKSDPRVVDALALPNTRLLVKPFSLRAIVELFEQP